MTSPTAKPSLYPHEYVSIQSTSILPHRVIAEDSLAACFTAPINTRRIKSHHPSNPRNPRKMSCCQTGVRFSLVEPPYELKRFAMGCCAWRPHQPNNAV